uniref:Uncharacterized protein n=1 Tax=Desertifilum tharense IPPAS B-1220 TaxID=1781255 RepID=A0ACD5H0M2_9CYAN
MGKKRMGGWGGGEMGGKKVNRLILLDTYSQFRYLVCKLQNKRTSFPTQYAVARKLPKERG